MSKTTDATSAFTEADAQALETRLYHAILQAFLGRGEAWTTDDAWVAAEAAMREMRGTLARALA